MRVLGRVGVLPDNVDGIQRILTQSIIQLSLGKSLKAIDEPRP